MTLLFLILLLLLALAAQMRVFQCSLKMLRSDYWPERKIVDPEDPFDVVVSVRNMSSHYVPFVKVEEFFREPIYVQQQDEHISGDAVRGGALFTGTADLRAYQEVQFRIPVAVRERGRYVLGHPELAGGDFLGLREKTKTMEQYREIVVAPREISEPEISQVMGSFLGDLSVRRFLYEDPVLTVGFREYTGREPMKMISWKQSARRGSWMVNQYDDTTEASVTVLLNLDSLMLTEERAEWCFSAARTVCTALEKQRIPYRFRTNAVQAGGLNVDADVGEGLGEVHFLTVLECLGRGMAKAADSMERLIREAEERERMAGETSRGIVFLTPGKETVEGYGSSAGRSEQGNLLILSAMTECEEMERKDR